MGSLNCVLSSVKEKGIDAEVLNQYLSSHQLTQRVKVLYSDNAREHLKVLYSDNAREHLSHAFDAFLFDMMIDQRFSVVDSQHQNGLSENVGERVCRLLVLNLVSSTLPCIRRPRPRLRVLDVCGFV